MLRPFLMTTTFIALSSAAFADTITVGPGGSIQGAINAAGAGDEIVVAPGTYYEAINFNGKAVTLRSSGGADNTTIDATGQGESVVRAVSGEDADTVLDGFTITGGVGSYQGPYRLGGGMLVYTSAPTVRNCVFRDNHAHGGGGMQVKVGWATVENCTFVNNVADGLGDFGGAGMHTNLGAPIITNCQFIDNVAADGAGGGGVNIVGGTPDFTNCLFKSNEAHYGGGIKNNNGRPTISNCTVTDNTAVNTGGGLRSTNTSGLAVVSNSIFWNNSAAVGDEIYDQAWALTTVNQSCVRGGWYGLGGGNMDTDPMFGDEMKRLGAGSPCVDAGDTASVTIDVDLDGMARIFNGAVDMGAYETHGEIDPTTCAADLDGSSVVGFEDLAMLLGDWGACSGCSGDFDFSGTVGFDDLSTLLEAWGPCS